MIHCVLLEEQCDLIDKIHSFKNRSTVSGMTHNVQFDSLWELGLPCCTVPFERNKPNNSFCSLAALLRNEFICCILYSSLCFYCHALLHLILYLTTTFILFIVHLLNPLSYHYVVKCKYIIIIVIIIIIIIMWTKGNCDFQISDLVKNPEETNIEPLW